MTSVVDEANALIAPPEPAGRIAASAAILPSVAFRVETSGIACPVGNSVRYPNPAGGGTAVTLSEYAFAVAGRLQDDRIGNVRLWPADTIGPASGAFGFRVSMARQGAMG